MRRLSAAFFPSPLSQKEKKNKRKKKSKYLRLISLCSRRKERVWQLFIQNSKNNTLEREDREIMFRWNLLALVKSYMQKYKTTLTDPKLMRDPIPKGLFKVTRKKMLKPIWSKFSKLKVFSTHRFYPLGKNLLVRIMKYGYRHPDSIGEVLRWRVWRLMKRPSYKFTCKWNSCDIIAYWHHYLP